MIEPTGWRKVVYYTLGHTPPAATREWVERDVHTTGWQVRRLFQFWVGILVGIAILGPVIKGLSWDPWKGQSEELLLGVLFAGIIGGVLQATVFAGHVRHWTLAYYRRRWERQLRSETTSTAGHPTFPNHSQG